MRTIKDNGANEPRLHLPAPYAAWSQTATHRSSQSSCEAKKKNRRREKKMEVLKKNKIS